jgi:hypothetical protein
MRESYMRFVKTWIRFVLWSRILTPKRFVLYRDWLIQAGGLGNPDSRIQTLKICIADLICDLNFLRFGLFSQIQRILTNPHESSQILSTIAQNESLQIQAGGLANLDSQIRTLRICIADLFCRPVFERFISWICFVDLFWKIRIVDSIYKAKNLKRFDLFCFGRIRVRIPHP